MNKSERFTLACDVEDRRLLAFIARKLRRSQGDVIRWLIRETAIKLKAVDYLQPDNILEESHMPE